MPITLAPDATKRLHQSIKRYAQKYFNARVLDLEGVCHEPEFSYWKAKP